MCTLATTITFLMCLLNCASRAHYLSCKIWQNFDAAFFKELNLQKPRVDIHVTSESKKLIAVNQTLYG